MYEPIYCGGYGYYNPNDKQHYERIKFPLYIYILAVIVCIIPILNILATIIYIAYCTWDDDLIIKGPIGKIGEFLNKKL
jgi:hypothetical protein